MTQSLKPIQESLNVIEDSLKKDLMEALHSEIKVLKMEISHELGISKSKSKLNAKLCEKRRRLEWKKALEKANGNISKAARIYCSD